MRTVKYTAGIIGSMYGEVGVPDDATEEEIYDAVNDHIADHSELVYECVDIDPYVDEEYL
jgi:hypothetical protein